MSDLEVSVTESVGRLRLNRPEAINALTLPMLRALGDTLTAWSTDAAVSRVELTGAGERGFCAGADVRQLRSETLSGVDPEQFFRIEYRLIALIARYVKPITARLHGIVMGGGLGLAANAGQRVVSPGARLAMPETMIGLFPDVGVLWFLARAPGELGTHLALTGEAVGASDAILLGLADRCEGGVPEPARLPSERSWIDSAYAGDDPVAIVKALETSDVPQARRAARTLRQRSPLSVCVSLEALRRAQRMKGVEEVLAQDLRLAPRLVRGPDFAEGVRAQLVDKDRQPRWRHARIEEVSRQDVLGYFTA